MGLDLRMWNFCNGFVANRKEQSRQTRQAASFRSKEARNRAIRWAAYSSIQYCNSPWRTTWQSGKTIKKTSDCATKRKIAWQICVSRMTCCCSRRRWESWKRWCETSRAWKSTQTKQRNSAIKIMRNDVSSRLTTSRWKFKKVSARYLGQKSFFEEQEMAEIKNRLKAAWVAFHKYRQELTSRSYRLCHRLRLFNVVITPTLTYASGKWTLSKTHERMIKSGQRKMLRLIVQTKGRYKMKTKIDTTAKWAKEEGKQKEMVLFVLPTRKQVKVPNRAQNVTRTVMFLSKKMKTKKSTAVKQKKIGSNSSKEVRKKPKNTWRRLTCWIEAHRRMKWRMVKRIASLLQEPWTIKMTECNPGLDNKIRANRSVGRLWKDGKTKQRNFWDQKKQKKQKATTWKTTAHGKRKQRHTKDGKQKKRHSRKGTTAKLRVDEPNLKSRPFPPRSVLLSHPDFFLSRTMDMNFTDDADVLKTYCMRGTGVSTTARNASPCRRRTKMRRM